MKARGEPTPNPSEEGNSTAPESFSRRSFLRAAALTALATAGSVTAAETAAPDSFERKTNRPSRGFIDTNVTLGQWPFRHLPLEETSALVPELRKHGVTQAWAGSFDGIFHKDIAAANVRLARACREQGRGLLVPFGSVNPKLPNWEEDLRRCHEQLRMPGVRLHPNYHGYKLDEAVFAKLLSLATARRLIVQIAVSMEDERMQSVLARVPEVDVAPLPALLNVAPAPRVVLLNWFRSVKGDLLKKLADMGDVWFDIATVEGVGGIANLLNQIPASRVVFGSHAPFFYHESALLKLRESALSKEQTHAISADNVRRVLSRS